MDGRDIASNCLRKNDAFDVGTFPKETCRRVRTSAEFGEDHHLDIIGASDPLQVAHEGGHGIRRVGEQPLVQIALEHMRVERVVPVCNVVEVCRHPRVNQGHNFRQIQTRDSVIHRGLVFCPGLPDQRGRIARAPSDVQQKSS